MNKFLFPCFNGVYFPQKKIGVLCFASKKGSTFLQYTKPEYNPIVHTKIPFLRGVEYLFFGTFYFIFGLHQVLPEKRFKTTEIISNSLNISKETVWCVFSIFLALGTALLIFGILPTHAGFWLSSAIGSSFFAKKLVIAITKCTVLYLFMLVLRFIPAIKQLYRFNCACNIVLNSDIKLKKHRAQNYLNYIFFSLLTSNFVISFISLEMSVWLRPLFNISILLVCFSVSYEICLLFDTILKKYSHIVIITSFFVTVRPSQTELDIARTAYNEGILMFQRKREPDTEKRELANHIAFSFVYSKVKEELEKSGITDISETDWLIANALKMNRTQIKLLNEIEKSDYQKIIKALERRKKGEPISKIFEKTNFYGFEFAVTKDVLSPRQETEILVEQALKYIADKKLDVLDLCTGSGIIGICIAKKTRARVVATDISPKAIEVAKQNSGTNNVSLSFALGDMFSALKKKQKFDVIISNPPYIKTERIKSLETEVKDHDPKIALDGGKSGMKFYHVIAENADKHLKKNGIIFLEIGFDQAKDIKKLFSNFGYNVRIVKDYSGNDRVAIATKEGK